jgi:exodeoxyribonuclease X
MSMLRAEGVEVPKNICTLRVARHLDADGLIPEYNLQYLRYHFGLEVPGNPHDAEGDVNVLVAVFDKLLSILTETGLSREEAISQMMEISSHPSLYRVFGFGKHKDKTLEEVFITDPGYLDWLLRQKLESGEEDEDWIYTLKYYLGK